MYYNLDSIKISIKPNCELNYSLPLEAFSNLHDMLRLFCYTYIQ